LLLPLCVFVPQALPRCPPGPTSSTTRITIHSCRWQRQRCGKLATVSTWFVVVGFLYVCCTALHCFEHWLNVLGSVRISIYFKIYVNLLSIQYLFHCRIQCCRTAPSTAADGTGSDVASLQRWAVDSL
jgi:hypothetical protein